MSPINRLTSIEEFQKTLNSYRPSQENINLLKDMQFVFMVGPTASGRNTLINILLKSGKYHYIVSDTTRYPRSNNGIMEADGNEYWFVSEENFLDGLKNGEYLEAAIIHSQQVSGISMRELKRASQSKKIAIDEIEVEGALSLRSIVDKGLFVFLLPPSFDVWMQRLNSRGDIHDDELKRRLESALQEMESALKHDFYQFVINNEIHEAAHAVDELAHGRTPDYNKQAHGVEHVTMLITEVKDYLRNL